MSPCLPLFKRSNGVYYAIFTDEFGRRKWISTKEDTKQAALKKLPEISERKKEKLPRITLLAKFFCDFTAYAKGVYLPETLSIYNRALRKFLEITDDRLLPLVSARHVDQFKAKRLQEVAPVTVNIELRSLKAAFNTALRWKLIEENPCKGVKQCAVPEVMPVYFSVEDFSKLVEAITQEWFRNVVVVAVLTGMRRNEILNLRWQDVDLGRRVIWIQSNAWHRTKCGKKRIIPMNPTVYKIVAELAARSHNDYVFTMGGEHISDRALSVRFKRLVGGLKLDNRSSFS